ncbi:MAG: hypothetical protein AMS18_16385 [Gemmatimonas sp. SG8_17]|nr:MAG: hypothetical protein AMS18_16385 [Gemmatimonas sp. SG8_17]
MKRCILLLGLVPLAGCGGGAPTPPVVRDSGGVTIIENFEPQWGRADSWRLADTPVVDIGGADVDSLHKISRPVGCLRLEDGRIVVANAGTQELRWFDPTGRYLLSSGSRGEGSTHFAALEWLGTTRSGDVAAFDFGRLQLSLFDPAGSFEQSISLVITFQAEPGSVRGVLADSSLVVIRDVRHWARSMTQEASATEGLIRGPARVSHYSATGEYLHEIGTFRGAERIFTKGSSRIVRVFGRPFGRAAVFAVSDDRVYVGTQDTYQIESYDIQGRLTAVVRVVREPRPVTAEIIERYVRGRLTGVHERERAERQRQLAALPYPDTMPAYGAMLTDSDENLWVAEYRPFGDGTPTWTVFDADHRMLGTVETPRGLAVHQIGTDFVIGSYRDEEDAYHIRVYRLEKPPEGG